MNQSTSADPPSQRKPWDKPQLRSSAPMKRAEGGSSPEPTNDQDDFFYDVS